MYKIAIFAYKLVFIGAPCLIKSSMPMG